MSNWVNEFLAQSDLSQYPIVGHPTHGLIFQTGHERTAVLQVQPVHTPDGLAIDTALTESAGKYSGVGTPGIILPSGEVQFLGMSFRQVTKGVGVFDIVLNQYAELASLPNGLANNDRITRQTGIYQYEHILTERGVKEQVILDSKPPNLSGDLFVIETEILDLSGNLPADGPLTQPYQTGEDMILFPGDAWDANHDRIPVQAQVISLPNPKKVLIYYGVPIEWLDAAAYPVTIDPTYSSQAASADTYLHSDGDSNTNFGTSAALKVGEDVKTGRVLIKWDLSSIPNGALVSSATMSVWLYSSTHQNAITHEVRMLLRDWTEGGATHNKYDGTNSWTTAGAVSDGNDRVSTMIGSLYYPASAPTMGQKDFSLTTTEVDKWFDGTYANYGICIHPSAGPGNQAKYYRSAEYGTSTQRPKLEIVYTTSPMPTVIPNKLTLFNAGVGQYDTRVKLRAAARDTALTTKVRN